MRKLILSFLILLSCTAFGQQRSTIKGSVADSIDKKSLQNTLITLMRVNDSALVRFTRADKAGNFSISNLDSGKFIVMITHPYLGDYFDNVEVTAGVEKDLGTIQLIPKSKLLAEVIIKSGSPIRIKGDTTVYTADSFKVRPGANVEELLRRLPGIQVDKNGQITAMGEKVKKVLVDGEEFFGSDPGIATKNLRADVVKEVEVFDKKSDQAEFTGIDDGVKDKTINLKLKDDKKKGYFGKAELGGGLKDKYNNSIMINAFKAKRKLAAYTIMSNTGQTNLDWQDASNYGGGMDGMTSGVTDDGGMYISMSTPQDENFRGGQNGIPTNWNGGLHYSNKFNGDRLSLNMGYKYSKVNAPGQTTKYSTFYTGNTGSFKTFSQSNDFSSRNKHALNVTIDTKLDSMNSLKWTTRANHNTTDSRSRYYTESIDSEGDTLNNSRRNSTNSNENNGINSTLLWRHKFKKPSRTLSVNTDLTWNRTSNNGLLFSYNNYFNKGLILSRDTTSQQNLSTTESQGLTTRVTYTEPIAKDMYFELSYALSYNNNNNDRITNKIDSSAKYVARIDSLSNAFTFKRLVNTPGLNFRVNKKKYTYSFGASVGFSHFLQDNQTAQTELKYNYVNFFPQASFLYKLKPSQNLRFNYSGSTTAPTPEQLQPISVNTDPLNVYIGNQNLKQSFRHNLNFTYSNYNTLKQRNLWLSLQYALTQHAFSQFSTVDSVGKRTYQTVNVDGVSSLTLYSDYGFKIGDSRWRVDISPYLSRNQNVDFVRDSKNNTVKNTTTNSAYTLRLNLGQYVDNKYEFSIGPSFSWNKAKGTVSTQANVKYWQLIGDARGSYTFGKSNVSVESDISYQVRQKDPRYPANSNFTIWNADIVKRFHKNDYELKFGIYDILKQNRGFQRDFNSVSFTETYYNTLKRFWLLTFTWNFSKNGKAPTSMFGG